MGKTVNLTSLNLIDYAKQHRYRLRNLHDGHPCPPARAPRVGERGREVAFRADDDREMAIVGSRGYVTAEDHGLGFMLAFKSKQGKTLAMQRLAGTAVEIRQERDEELAGWAPVGCLDVLLTEIRVSKLNAGSSPERMAALTAARTTEAA